MEFLLGGEVRERRQSRKTGSPSTPAARHEPRLSPCGSDRRRSSRRKRRAENVGVDAEDIDGVAPELIFVGKVFDREGDAAGVILLDQAVLMECPRLSFAGAFVAGVVADDARVAGQAFGVLR